MTYTRKKLKNGLTIITLTSLSSKAATITAYIRAGFRFDPKNRPGLSHFTEHIIFNAQKNFPKFKTLSQAVERHGGWSSAFTWIENQEYTIHLPKNNVEDGIKLILGNLFEPYITKSEVEKEKGVIKEEILTNKSDPSKAIWDYAWLPLFFQGTNLSRPYSGNITDISMISEIDVKSFVSSYFQTENIVLFVAGNLEQDYIRKIVEKYSKKYKAEHKEKNIYTIVPKVRKHVFVYKDESYYQTSLVIGIKTIAFKSSLKYVFDILRDMLSGYFGAPLIQELRDKGGLIYTWNSYHDNLSDIGYLMFNVAVAHENINRVTSIVLKEFKRLAQGKFIKDEVEMAKSHLIGSILSNTETGKDYIEFYGLQELLNPKNVLSIENKINLYKNVSAEEVREVASKYFTPENTFIAAIGTANENQLESLL
ncbi:insulinase family protein [Candidatus Roizmanbacteria bacterium]|nr:insulinase family protein [Candidatus Roizmanbacteria bacterium]